MRCNGIHTGGALDGDSSTAHVFVAAFVSAAAMVFFDAAGFGLLPSLVPRARLADAVGRQTAMATVITMAGPALGGVLIAASSPFAALALNAATFAVTAILLLWVREPTSAPRTEQPHLWRDIGNGVRFIYGHPLVRLLTLIGTGNSVAGGIMTGLLVVTAVERYGVDEDGGELGLFFAALGVGTLISTALLPRLSRKFTAGTIAIAGLLAQAGAISVWILATVPVLGVCALVVFQSRSIDGDHQRHHRPPPGDPGRTSGPRQHHGPHAGVGRTTHRCRPRRSLRGSDRPARNAVAGSRRPCGRRPVRVPVLATSRQLTTPLEQPLRTGQAERRL